MFLVSRTLSRQHPFPMCGKRPAIASNNPDERPATTVETLIRQISGTAYNFKYKVSDGEQGWYRIKLAGSAHYQGMSSTYGGSEIVDYIAYLCPNTLIQLWNSNGSAGGTTPDEWDSPAREPSYAVFGASGAPESAAGSGSQCGFGAGAGGYSPNSPVGGAGSGFVASLATCSEWDYCTHNNLICKTYYGYSRCPTIKLVVNGSTVVFTRNTTLDGSVGWGWDGLVPDPESSTGGTLPAVGYTQYRNPRVGDEIVVYYASDLTTPIATTSIEETTLESVFIQTVDPDFTSVENVVYSNTGEILGKVTYNTNVSGYREITLNQNNVYSYDERAETTLNRQNYYAWRRTITPGENIEYTTGEVFWTNSPTPQDCGKNGVFVYKRCGDNICITTIKFDTNNAVRVPSLDMPGNRVVFGATPTTIETLSRDMKTNRSFLGLKDNISRSTGNNGLTVSGSGAYLLLLSGGGGYRDTDGNPKYCGGCALGSIIKYDIDSHPQTGGYDYAISRGVTDAFGGTWSKDGAACIVDLNDMLARDRVIAAKQGITASYNTVNKGYVEIYKISDSTDVTAYAQKIFFPASDRGYNASVEINGSLVTNFEIKASINLTERFVPGVKQGDVIIITLHANDDSEVTSLHDITTETIAFGIFLDNAPWREREYTTTTDKQLGFAPGTYGAMLVSGGGAGGYATSGRGYPGCGGRGGSSDLQKIRFTVNDYCVAHIHVGAGGIGYSNGGEAGVSGGGIGSYGGAGGEPTLLAFTKDVNVESMPVRLYSWTNGSSVMYTRNSVPDEPNKLTKFCDATGALNGKTAYSTGTGNSTALVCQQDGLTYSNVSVSGNPNIDLSISGLVRCIFTPATGGGGGGGGMDSASRLTDGGSGAGGGGWYRVDLENRHFYSINGANGGNGNSGGQQGGVGNIIDGYTVVANRGENGANTSGKNGGAGYGAGGGAGGQGANHGTTYAGKGGGGAPGDSGGAFGWWSNGAVLPYDDMVPVVKYYEGKPLVYGMGGKGELRGNLSTGVPAYDAPRSNGNNGYLYIYSFSSVDEVIDAGAISSEITETIDCGTINGSIEQTINCDLL